MGEISFFKVSSMYNFMSQSHARTIQGSCSLAIILYSMKNVDVLLLTQMLELPMVHMEFIKGNTLCCLFSVVNCSGWF